MMTIWISSKKGGRVGEMFKEEKGKNETDMYYYRVNR